MTDRSQKKKARMRRDARARRKFRRAVECFVRSYPYHIPVILLMRFSASARVDTMGVTLIADGVRLLYNVNFVNGLTPEELVGTLHHEVNHVLFRHLHVDQAKFEDREARILAEELTVNEWVPEKLPGDPITLADYPDLPPNESTDVRYERLAARKRPKSKDGPEGRGVGDGDGPGGKGGGKGSGKGGRRGKRKARNGACPDPGTLDDHEIWQEGELERRSREAVEQAIAEAYEKMGDGRPGESRSIWRRLFASSAAEELLLENETADTRPIDWRKELSRYLGDTVKRELVLHRYSRRLPALTGIVPVPARVAARPRLLVAIDTSSSMKKGDLEAISVELERLRRDFELHVVECDNEIRAAYAFKGRIKTVKGRGGTDLCPPFERDFLTGLRPNAMVYFTDGQGPAPETAPRMPVIWCLSAGGRRPAPWGKVVRMESDGDDSVLDDLEVLLD